VSSIYLRSMMHNLSADQGLLRVRTFQPGKQVEFLYLAGSNSLVGRQMGPQFHLDRRIQLGMLHSLMTVCLQLCSGKI
jgi:hypothetical protein